MAKAYEWEGRVARWRASGLSSAEFCKAHGYAAGSLLWWSSQLRRKGSSKPAVKSEMRLARVERTPREMSGGLPSVLIEIGGARVAVQSGVDAATLRTVFEALGARGAAR